MKNDNLFWFDNVESRPHPWPGLIWITTLIQVPDVTKARDLYVNVFDFVPIFNVPDPENPGEVVMTRLRYRGANFVVTKEGTDDYEGIAPASSKTPPPFVFYVYVDNVDETFKKALQAGMKVVLEPGNTYWGDKRARLRCQFGYLWDIAERVS
jgi:PhnB protein